MFCCKLEARLPAFPGMDFLVTEARALSLSGHSKGLLLATGGVLLISPDSLLIRFLYIDFGSIMFLRGAFIGLTLALLIRLSARRTILESLQSMDVRAWVMAFLMAVSSFFFVAAIQTTSVAHVLIIVGSVPVFTAILAWVMLGEGVDSSTVWTILVVFTGLIFVVGDQGESSLLGDLLALMTCLAWSLNLVLARRSRTPDMALTMMISGCLMMLGGLFAASFSGLDTGQFVIGSLLGVLNGLALYMLVSAPRYIPAAQVAVLLPVETVLGSLLVWAVLGEHPGLVSLLAGTVIVMAIMLNGYLLCKHGQS